MRNMDLGFFCGSASPDLAQLVANELGVPLSKRMLRRFSDGEVHVRIEESVRGRDIYILQSTCPPVDQHLMELLVMIEACRRAAAGRITAIIPYYGYARQEKKSVGREPITARLVADLLTIAGAQRVVTVDVHSPAMQGFFSITMDSLPASPILIEYLKLKRRADQVVVSPDLGYAKLSNRYARALDLPLIVLHKERLESGEVEVQRVIGNAAGRQPIIVDDMITSGGTIEKAVEALLEAGARPEITVVASHGLLVENAPERLSSPAILEVVITDTVPVPVERRWPKLTVLSVAKILAEAVRRLNQDRSIEALYPN